MWQFGSWALGCKNEVGEGKRRKEKLFSICPSLLFRYSNSSAELYGIFMVVT